MAIPETSRDDIIDALETFDAEHRHSGEWKEWQNNRNHEYAIEFDGRLYPVEMIVSLAADTPRNTFHGGKEANRHVRNREFDVVRLHDDSSSEGSEVARSDERANTWMFQAHPDRYDLPEELQDVEPGDIDEWSARQHRDEIEIGDVVLLWSASGGGQRTRGIYAVARIAGPVVERFGSDFGRFGVPIRYVEILDEPIEAAELKANDVLSELSILKAPQGTNFDVSPQQWGELRDAYPQLDAVEPDVPVDRVFVPPSRRDRFDELLERCLREFDWKTHVESFETSREECRTNWEELQTKRERDEDVGDAVAQKLLPHSDDETARQKGYWTHLTGFATELQNHFEAQRWVEPDEWNDVAEALLDFFEYCLDSPDDFGEVCRDFASSKYATGFQAATLTPTLNALNPDDYSIYNSKVVDVVRFLTGIDTDGKLVDYPEHNERLHRILDELEPPIEARLDDPSRYRTSDVFDMFAHWLVAESDVSLEGRDPEVWAVEASTEERWDQWAEEGVATVDDWSEFGDVSELDRKAFESKSEEIASEYDCEESILNQVCRFASLQPGDTVVAHRDGEVVWDIGKVQRGYHFAPEAEMGVHHIGVDWRGDYRRSIDEPDWQRTVKKLDEATLEEVESARWEREDLNETLEEILQTADNEEQPAPPPLESAHNEILYGPPGTGKTYDTRRRAVELCLRPDQELSREEIEEAYDRLYQEGRIRFVTFHQSYAYEEFVEGIRPIMPNDASTVASEEGPEYRCRDGIFKEIALRATAEGLDSADPRLLDGGTEDRTAPKERARRALQPEYREADTFDFRDADDYVLVVDEINRGNLARIFGELISLLEPSKRLTEPEELTLELPYSDEHFAVPPNLHVVGTMNTADRSIALIDAALRRRFEFEARMPDVEVLVRQLDDHLPDDEPDDRVDFINLVAAVFENLNARIRMLRDADHQIGHTYLMDVSGWNDLRDTFLDEIVPLLREYFHDSWKRLCLTLGCPYDRDGSPSRTASRVLQGGGNGYSHPMIEAHAFESTDVFGRGVEHRPSNGELDFEVEADFASGNLEDTDIRKYVEHLLAPEYHERYDSRDFWSPTSG